MFKTKTDITLQAIFHTKSMYKISTKKQEIESNSQAELVIIDAIHDFFSIWKINVKNVNYVLC